MDRVASRTVVGIFAFLCSAVVTCAPVVSRAAEDRAAPAAPAKEQRKPASATTVKQPPSRNGATGQAKAAEAAGSEKMFGEWTLQCLNSAAAQPRCQIIHRLLSPDGKQVMLVLSLAPISKGGMGLQLALPLGFAIQSGVKLTFGSRYTTTAAVSRCTAQGCLVEGPAPEKMIFAMQKEKSGAVSVQTVRGETIKLALGLDGFTAAYDAMRKEDGAGSR